MIPVTQLKCARGIFCLLPAASCHTCRLSMLMLALCGYIILDLSTMLLNSTVQGLAAIVTLAGDLAVHTACCTTLQRLRGCTDAASVCQAACSLLGFGPGLAPSLADLPLCSPSGGAASPPQKQCVPARLQTSASCWHRQWPSSPGSVHAVWPADAPLSVEAQLAAQLLFSS